MNNLTSPEPQNQTAAAASPSESTRELVAPPAESAAGNESATQPPTLAPVAGVTILAAYDRRTISKRFTLTPRGELQSEPPGALAAGTFERKSAPTPAALAQLIGTLGTHQAFVHGIAKSGEAGIITTLEAIANGTALGGAIPRSGDAFTWPEGPAWLMLDVDLKDLPAHLSDRLDPLSISRIREALIDAVPQLAHYPMLGMASASAMIFREPRQAPDSLLRGLTGARFYVLVAEAQEIADIGRRIHERLILAGWGWAFISKAGTIPSGLRSLVDTAVWQPERLDYAGGAALDPGLAQDRGTPVLWHADSAYGLTLAELPALTEPERTQIDELTKTRRAEARPEAARIRAAWAEEQHKKGRRVNLTTVDNREELRGEHDILRDGSTVTVDEILAEPEKYHGLRCHDPVEPGYGGGDPRIAVIYANQPEPLIFSHAHGGTTYFLVPSAAAEFKAIEPSAAVDTAAEWGDLPPFPAETPRTDRGNALRFARANRNRIRYSSGRWLAWDGKRWAVDATREVERRAMAQTRKMLQEAAAIDDEELRKPEVAWALKSDSHERRTAMLKDAGALLPMPAETLDSDPYLFNVENGTLDLRMGSLRPHSPADRITKLAPVVCDPAATAPTWKRFLHRIFDGDQELIRFVQKAVGYTLTGLVSEQAMFLLWGTGQNGKSTFITTLQSLLGDYARQAAFDTFLAASKSTPGGARPDITRLKGARLISALEAPAGARLAETVVKSLTGGDIIAARDLYSSGSEFRMEGKLWLAANNKPEIRGNDLAIWRRIRLVPFTVTIPEEEKDPQLADKLKAELAGILNWALEGFAAWQREGLGVPVAVERATAGYRAESDSIAAFINEECIVAPGLEVTRKELYEAYHQWSTARGEVPSPRKPSMPDSTVSIPAASGRPSTMADGYGAGSSCG